MRRRQKATKFSDLTVMVVAGLIIYYTFAPQLTRLTWVLLGIAVLMFWISFLMPTHCDYQTQRNKPCDREVRGKLRGCRSHGRWKRDALFAAIRLKNPGLLLRTMWSAPGQPPPRSRHGQSLESIPATATRQSANDVAMLTFTVVSTLAAVIALFK